MNRTKKTEIMIEAEDNPDDIDQLSRWLWDVAYLGDVLPLPLDEFIDKLLSGQMVEIYQLGEESDKDLAMTRYYKRKIRLLELQAKILKLLFNADNKQKQRIEMLDEGLMKLLDLLELVKKARIEISSGLQ